MVKIGFIIIVLLFIQPLFSQPSEVDVVYLKNGLVIKGKIIEDNQDQKILKIESGESLFIFQYDEIRKKTREEVDAKNLEDLGEDLLSRETLLKIHELEESKKSAGISWLLSFAIPGAGQFYNEDYLRGGIMLGVYVTGVTLFTVGFYRDTANRSYENPADYDEETSFILTVSGATITVVTYFWSMIDAPVTTKYKNSRIDKKIQELKRLGRNQGSDSNLKFALFPSFNRSALDGVNLKLFYQF